MSLELVRALNERAGCRLELVGLIDRGQSGAAYVRWPDGRESVVTTAFATMDRMRQTAEILADVRALGIPVPAHEFLHDLGDGTIAVVQERLTGSTANRADVDIVDAIIAMNERFAGLLVERPDVQPPRLSLGRPGDPIPTDLIEAHSERARRLLRVIRGTAGEPGRDVVGDDLVHVDLTVPNMLFDPAGTISGVVDWNYGVDRGDRYFGLMKLLHTLSFDAARASADHRPTDQAVARVERRLTECLAPDTFRRYWAGMTLAMMYVSLRWGTEEAFSTYLEFGEAKLARGPGGR